MTEYLSPSSEMLVQCAIKSTVILAAAGLLTVTLFRRASAAARHLVWVVAFVAVLVLPVLSLRLPAWRVLPAWTGPQSEIVQSAARESPIVPKVGDSVVSRGPMPAPAGGLPDPAGGAGATPVMVAPEPAEPVPTVKEVVAVPGRSGSIGLATILLGVWGAGALAALIPLLLAPLLLRRLRRRAVPLREASWMGLLAELRGQLRVRRRVMLLQGRTTVPASFGILSPTILVPAGGDKGGMGVEGGTDCGKVWPAERRRIVLLHELAHIKRHDHLTLLVAQIACAVYWFHPLAWVAARRLHVERERACDDLVLGAGVEAPAYARMLLRIVQGFTKAAAPRAALHMATPSTLEQRVRAILAPAQNRRRMPILSVALFVAISFGILIPLSMLRAEQGAGPAEWRELARRLSSDDYATREAAQKELEKIPQEQFALLKTFAEAQTDPEVKARLQKRLEDMEVYGLLHPPPLSVHLKNAGIDSVIGTLNKQMGGKDLILTPDQYNAVYLRSDGTGFRPPLPEDATFSLDAEKEPFWVIVHRLAAQHPFYFMSTRTPQLHAQDASRNLFPPGVVWEDLACDGFMLRTLMSDDGNQITRLWARAMNTVPLMGGPMAPIAGAIPLTRPIDPAIRIIEIMAYPDPRIRIHLSSPSIQVDELIDDSGTNLMPGLLPAANELATPETLSEAPHFFVFVRLPTEHGRRLASFKGSFRVTLIAEENDLTLDRLQDRKVIPLVRATLSINPEYQDGVRRPALAGSTMIAPAINPLEGLAENLQFSTAYLDLVDRAGHITSSSLATSQYRGGVLNTQLVARPDVKTFTIKVRQPLRTIEACIPFHLRDVPFQ